MTNDNQVTDVLFTPPPLTGAERAAIDQIDDLKAELQRQLYEPRRWAGSLRRLLAATAIQASTSIEGYHAELDDVAAVGDREEPLDASLETKLALIGYREAMTYVLQLSREPRAVYSEQLIKSLHFMMTSYDLESRPGRWRSGSVYVNRESTGEIMYEAPPFERLDDLMAALVANLNAPSDLPPMIRGAMAHLNLVMIHPFRDGNGRMARCLQTLVLANEGVLAPQFCSIEEYLGNDTAAYYQVLGEVGSGSWHPERDARPWIRLALVAHLHQARLLQIRVRESEALWVDLARLVAGRGLPERTLPLLWDAAHGLRVRNATYRTLLKDVNSEEVSEAAASRDLKLSVERGLLTPNGEKRGRFYTATPELFALWDAIKGRRPPLPTMDGIFAD